MKCYVYRSGKQDEMYLYLRDKDKFADVPQELLSRFGKAEFVMELDLASRARLARENIATVRQSLQARGFFLQMPPRIEGHLYDGD